METPLARPHVAAQAAKLTLGVWAFTFILFLMPVVAATGRLPQFVVGMTAVVVLFGMALSALLYWACARLQDAPTPLKVGGVFGAVCLAAFAFSLGDVLLGGNLDRDVHVGPPDPARRRQPHRLQLHQLLLALRLARHHLRRPPDQCRGCASASSSSPRRAPSPRPRSSPPCASSSTRISCSTH